jgi:hypothetical protein
MCGVTKVRHTLALDGLYVAWLRHACPLQVHDMAIQVG